MKKECSEGPGLLPSLDHNDTDAHTGYNVHREALNEADQSALSSFEQVVQSTSSSSSPNIVINYCFAFSLNSSGAPSTPPSQPLNDV